MPKTFERYVEIARGLRLLGSTTLDIKNLNANEAYIITELVKNDNIFNFFDKCKDIDIHKLFVSIKYLDAMDELKNLM